MSAVVEGHDVQSGRQATNARWWTAADLAALPETLPTGPAYYLLWEGALRLMSPPGDLHAATGAPVITVLTVYGQWEGHGLARDDVGIVVEQNPDTVLEPDAAFITNNRLPLRRSSEGYLLTIPELVVEVRSKNDTGPEIEEKVRKYVAAGVQVVWAPDPVRKTVLVYVAGEEPVVLHEADNLTAEGIIPGLAFPVQRLFEGLD